MLQRWIGMAAVLVVLGLLTPGLVEARKREEPKAVATETDAKNEVDLSDLGTAFQLIEYGREHQAPEALITAAGLMRNVARAKLTDLDVNPMLVDDKGDAIKADVKSEKISKLDLKKEAKDLIEEATLLGLKQKTNLVALIRGIEKRELKGEAGSVKAYTGSLGGNQTLVFRLKVASDQATRLAVRSTEALRISVVRNEDKSTLAAALTTGGNVFFQPNKGGEMTRGVRMGVRLNTIFKPKPRPKPPHHHVKRRAIGDGDCEVTLRINNPSKEEADFELFIN